MKRPRGYAMLVVIFLMALLAILTETSLRLLLSGLGETKRRIDRAYAGELALSGLDWGRACLESGRADCDAVLTVADGQIVVTVRPQDGSSLVRSEGRVVRRGVLAYRKEERILIAIPEPPAVEARMRPR